MYRSDGSAVVTGSSSGSGMAMAAGGGPSAPNREEARKEGRLSASGCDGNCATVGGSHCDVIGSFF